MKMIATNKHSSKLKIWRVEMPNAPYSNRYVECWLSPLDKGGKNVESWINS
jgi:hypothetical protein